MEFVFSPADEKFLKRFADVVRLQQQGEGSYLYEVFVDSDGFLDWSVWHYDDLFPRIDEFLSNSFHRQNCIRLFVVQVNNLGVFTGKCPLCTDALLDFFLEQL